uniref:Protein zwilch n=1 Tax=Caenorhabditis japonica TaxID=281687 RepID=A0A8R1E894_CAEJA
MSITLENLKTYNKTVQARKDDEPVPPPVLLLDKYRVRLLPLADLPIISQYSNLPQLGFNSDEVVVIDSPIISEEEKSTKLEPRVAPVVKEDEDEDREQMEFEDEDKENAGINGPLETSFLTLEKLEKRNGNGMEVDISGFDITLANFDTNPIPHADGVSLQKFLRLHAAENFADTIVKLPIWISTFSTNFPYVCWLAAGKTQKDQKFGAATRVLGYFDENSEKLVNQLNAACGGSQLNRYRAVYDEIRKIASEKRQNPGEVVLDMRWNTKNNVALLENPVNAAECTIKIDLGWQDKRFFVDESIFEQLFFVINLADVLGNPEHEVFFPHGKGKFDELVKEMNALVEACSDENKVFATLNDG